MSVDSSKLQETMFRAIDAIIEQRNNNLKLDKTITAIVKKNLGARSNRPLYQLQYEGGLIQATSNDPEAIYYPNTSVYVLIPQGDFSNEKFIIGRTSMILTEHKNNAVIATVNQTAIASPNLVKIDTNNEYGLHSFHPTSSNECDHPEHASMFIIYPEGENNPVDKVWTKTFDRTTLDTLKQDAVGLMIKADFKTKLDVIQTRQPGAVYGLIFNFSFKNLNAGYGETQGQILDSVGKIVQGSVVENPDTESSNYILINKTLNDYVESFETALKNNNDMTDEESSAYLSEKSKLKENIPVLLDSIDTLYNVFVLKNEKLNNEIIKETIESYKALLSEQILPILNKENITKKDVEDARNDYDAWKNTSVGESEQKIEQFVLTSDNMIGNPFTFDQWTTQYELFSMDLKNLDHLDSIVFFKQGFFEDRAAEKIWPLSPLTSDGGPDIFVKNIQIYAMKPLDAQSGDYSLKIEPADGSSNILNSSESHAIMNAKVFRKSLEDLTYSSNTKLYWFKENSSVVSTKSANYNYLAGKGWSQLKFDGQQWVFDTTAASNLAYKNNYKCVVTYEAEDGNQIVLSSTFSIYNLNAAIQLQLSSSLGTKFSYGAGVPVITVKIKDNSNNGDFQEKIDEKWRYIWAITDSVDGNKTFLTDAPKEEEDVIGAAARDSVLKGIKKYKLTEETDKFEEATRIEYPISLKSSGFTVDCYLQQNQGTKEESNWIEVGSDHLEIIIDQDGTTEETNTYRIYIENGDQVFQYDEYGVSPCSEKNKNPLKVLPLKAKLYSPAGVEIQDTNYAVEWIFPIDNSMLTSDETLIKNPRTNLIQMYQGYSFNFKIADIYNPDYYNNQITCHIHFGDKDLYKDTTFYFGKQGNNGTNGTDVVAKINFNGQDPNNFLGTQPLTILVEKNEDSDKNPKVMLNAPGFRSELKDTLTLTNGNDGDLKAVLYQKGLILDETESTIRWNIAGNPNSTRNLYFNYFNLTNNNLSFDPKEKKDNRLSCFNIRAEIQRKNKKDNNSQSYYAFYSIPTIFYENSIPLLIIDRITIDKNKYLNEITYNADGRYPVYNHNQGLKLNHLPKNSYVIWTVKGGMNSTYSGKEDDPDILLSFEKDGNDKSNSLITRSNSETSQRVFYFTLFLDAWSEYKTSGYGKDWERWQETKQEILAECKQKAYIKKQKEKIQNILKNKLKDNTQIWNPGVTGEPTQVTLKDITDMLPTPDTPKEDSQWWTDHIKAWWSAEDELESNWWNKKEKNNYNNLIKTNSELYPGNDISAVDTPLIYQVFCDHVFPSFNKWREDIAKRNDFIKEDGSAMVYVIPNDTYNGSATNNRIEAKIYSYENIENLCSDTAIVEDLKNALDMINGIEEEKSLLIATVEAPIHMSLNTFGLSSVNAWDGNSISIDEDKGSILAPQIGAGEKDANNRLTGIVMGSIENSDQKGLVGYTHGFQSIFLDATTGNADFGLRDGVALLTDANGNVLGQKADDYNEGRVELRPGGVSKIGGWRIGHRSLYYITDNDSQKLKEISKAYNDKWATKSKHQRDIGENDQGILLNAAPLPYISIKGKPLSVGNGDSFDINNSSGNAALADGDSLELVLDPNQKDFFTMFRHYEEDDKWKRTPLVGIDAMGRFYTNALKDKETSLNMNYVPGFGQSAINEKYVGLFIGYGANTIIKNFISVNDTDGSSTVFISGGSLKDEYARPISIHGKSISLYTGSGTGTSTTTNIKISSTEGEINVGNTKLQLTKESDNSLATVGSLTLDIGLTNKRKPFKLTASSKEVNLTNYTQNISSGSITTTAQTSTYKGSGSYDVYTSGTSTANSYLSLGSNKTVKLGHNNNLISMTETNGTWTANNTLHLKSETNRVLIESSGAKQNNDYQAVNGYGQIELRAGVAKNNWDSHFTLNSSLNNWGNISFVEKTNDAPQASWLGIFDDLGNGIYSYHSQSSSSSTAGLKNNYVLLKGSELWVSNGIRVSGKCWDKSGAIILDTTADTFQFNHTMFNGRDIILGNDLKYVSGAGYFFVKDGKSENSSMNNVTNLKQAIDICLRAAGLAKQAADNAQSAANTAQSRAVQAENNAKSYTDALKNSLKSAAYADVSAFRSSSWNPDLSGYMKSNAKVINGVSIQGGVNAVTLRWSWASGGGGSDTATITHEG